MALPSESFTSSIYSDSIDPLLFSFTPSEPPESQSTEPITPLTLPSSLQYVGGRKEYALWMDTTKTEFIEWWLSTPYAATSPYAKRVRWDRKGHSSKVWSYFNQIANIHNGTPMVICKRCHIILTHPVQNGTTGMGKHYNSSACKIQSKQATIDQLIKRVVS
jgi:hypothetical protein